MNGGLSAGILIRNTEAMRSFIREYVSYSNRGHLLFSDQTALNHLLISHLAESVKSTKNITKLLKKFEVNESCDMHIPYDFPKYRRQNKADYEKRLTRVS